MDMVFAQRSEGCEFESHPGVVQRFEKYKKTQKIDIYEYTMYWYIYILNIYQQLHFNLLQSAKHAFCLIFIDRRGYSLVNIVIGVVAVGFFSAASIFHRYNKI